MGLETKQLYSSPNGDRWYLVRDTDSGHVFVRHVPNLASGGEPEHIEIGAFLRASSRGPEHQELLRLIGGLVKNGSTDSD